MSAAQSHLSSGVARVLIVDDDLDIRHMLERYLASQGLQPACAANAAQMRSTLRAGEVDLVLLDLGLPDGDGLDLMRELREQWRVPVIVVSGRGASVERVVGLELGADDYLSKPFDLRELLARIRSVLRRCRPAEADGPACQDFHFGDWVLESGPRRLREADGPEVPLTRGEFDLLMAFLQAPQQVLSRDRLMNMLHGHDAGPNDRAIDMQVGRLRRKLERDPAHPDLIKSVRGAGYMLATPVRSR